MAISASSFFNSTNTVESLRREKADSRLSASVQLLGSAIIKLTRDIFGFTRNMFISQERENRNLNDHFNQLRSRSEISSRNIFAPPEKTNQIPQQQSDQSDSRLKSTSALLGGAGIAGAISSALGNTVSSEADIGEVTDAVKDPNVRSFLDVLAKHESGGAYNVVVGGGTFSDYSKHPERYNKELDSDAAGRYQFISTTYKPIAQRLGLKDFSPRSQDLAAVQYLKDLGVLDEVQSGDPKKVQSAIDRLKGSKWTGLQKYGPGEGVKYFQQRKQHHSKSSTSPTQTKPQSVSSSTSSSTKPESGEHSAKQVNVSSSGTKPGSSTIAASTIVPPPTTIQPNISMAMPQSLGKSGMGQSSVRNSTTATGSPSSGSFLALANALHLNA